MPLILGNMLKASEQLAHTRVLPRLRALMSTAKAAADAANVALARGQALRRIQPELTNLGVTGNVRCVWQGALTVVSSGKGGVFVGAGGAGEGGGGGGARRRYFIFNDGMVVCEDDGLGGGAASGGAAVNLKRRDFERVEDVAAEAEPSRRAPAGAGARGGGAAEDADRRFRIVYTGGVEEVKGLFKRTRCVCL
jgi:hypothetical protein